MKRHGFGGGPRTHGSLVHRELGATGLASGKMFKGTKMPGRMGSERKTVQNLRVVKVDPDTLNQATIERIIQEHTGNSIHLNSPDLLMFKPDNRDIDILQELKNLQTKSTSTSEGIWFRGSQVNFMHDSSGRHVKIGVAIPANMHLALN